MRYLLLALLALLLLPTPGSAFPNHGNPGGHFGLPHFQATVRDDCTNAAEQPCFEVICGRADGTDVCAAGSAVAYVEAQDVAGTGLRVVNIYPRSDATAYTEDIILCHDTTTTTVPCDTNGTGYTLLRGMTSNVSPTVAAAGHNRPSIIGLDDASNHPTVLMSDAGLENLIIKLSADTTNNEMALVTGTEDVGTLNLTNVLVTGVGDLKSLLAGETIAHFAYASGQVNIEDSGFYGFGVGADADSTVVLFDAGVGDKNAQSFTWFRGGYITVDYFSGAAGASALKLVNTAGQVQFLKMQIACVSPFTCVEWDDQNVGVFFSDTYVGYNNARAMGSFTTLLDRDTDDFAGTECDDDGSGINYGGDQDVACPASVVGWGSVHSLTTDGFGVGSDLTTANAGLVNGTHMFGGLHWSGPSAGHPGKTLNFDAAAEDCWPGWTFTDTIYGTLWTCEDDSTGAVGTSGVWVDTARSVENWMRYRNEFLTTQDFDIVNVWTDTAIGGGGATTLSDDLELGYFTINPGNTADTDGYQIQFTEAASAGDFVSAAAGRKVIFSTRVMLEQGTSDHHFAFGLADTTATVINADGTWNEANVTDAVVFYHDDSLAGIIECGSEAANANYVDQGDANAAAFTNGTWHTYTITITGLSEVEWWVDGVLVQSASIGNLGNEMSPFWVMVNGDGGADDGFSVDTLDIQQRR